MYIERLCANYAGSDINMILQSNGLHITLIADDMHHWIPLLMRFYGNLYGIPDQMPILAATIKQVLKKNPVANTVSASLPGTVTGELLVADSINVLDTFSDLGDKIRYLASCYKSDLTMRHSSCQENFKKILGSPFFYKVFPGTERTLRRRLPILSIFCRRYFLHLLGITTS